MAAADDARARPANDRPIRRDRAWVIYWMIAARRTAYNFALQRAVRWARELEKPLIVFEPLRIDYPWASDRLHRFVLDGMADNRAALRTSSVLYFSYVELRRGAGKGLRKRSRSRPR